MQAYLPNCAHNSPIIFETYTIEASKANKYAAGVAKEFRKTLEWVDVGEFFPCVINNALHYTFTIRGGNLV